MCAINDTLSLLDACSNGIVCDTRVIAGIAQLAVFEPARETLLQDASVLPALQAVVQDPMGEEARQFAEGALLALSGKELHAVTESQKHVMLSYQWSYQSVIARLNEALIARGYLTVRSQGMGVLFCL